jgi:hypothetical protein
MDGAAALRDLIHDVLDLCGEGPVLPPHLLHLQDGLLVGGLDAEQLGGGVPRLTLRVVQIQGQALHLSLPFSNNPANKTVYSGWNF